ncbi:hypothetical protein PLEOSDRAFT_1042646 [Pleurotus ostreatus PC15]|uniref:Fungal lipase-type domain-containing protein n=1 Tax=Pleurotus ostreatus (strain PC15) TaxID=1137138 RepID=A0A067NTR5_PLEO1|nr:hypothetical protein PLEOSDRAFT_1042646 [Pleurotus ostreatus PC15]
MRNLLVSWCLLLCTALLAYAAPVNIDAIDKTTYDNLVKYAKFAAAAYETNSKCKKPLGLGFDLNGTQGYLVIDDKAKEVILSFEGTFSPKDILTDIQFWRTALKTASYSDPKASVHAGFQKAWLVIEKTIMDTAARFVKEKKGYKWTIVGHSLGGAIAEYASLAIKAKYPDLKLTEYTYGMGAPRAGNDVWVKDLEKVVGANNIYRDIVPTMLGHWLGYKHPGTEYWQFKEPSSPENVKKCQGGEDPSCSSQYRKFIALLRACQRSQIPYRYCRAHHQLRPYGPVRCL